MKPNILKLKITFLLIASLFFVTGATRVLAADYYKVQNSFSYEEPLRYKTFAAAEVVADTPEIYWGDTITIKPGQAVKIVGGRLNYSKYWSAFRCADCACQLESCSLRESKDC